MHYADVIEGYADRAGGACAIVHGQTRRSWAEFEDRGARVGNALSDAGLQPDAKVGLLLFNCPEYYEGFLAALKMRMVPINVNYRYVDDELVQLLEDADAEALVFHASLGESVARVVARLPKLKLLVEVDDGPAAGVPGAQRYEDLLAAYEPAPRIAREPGDTLMIYTGGTTGLPKGVMYDVGDWTEGLLELVPIALGVPPVPDTLEGLLEDAAARIGGDPPAVLACSPLMHTAALGNSVAVQLYGGRAVTLAGRSFDADEIWRTAERERATVMIIVGDAFARPMLDVLDAARERGEEYDLTSLRVILSSGVMWSAPVKEGLLEHLDVTLIDGIGATEGAMGVQISRRDAGVAETGKFWKLGDTKLFSEDGREIEPGSDEPGLIAAGGKLIPRGYYKDPEKSARTFREVDGRRYAFVGDWGRLEADGRLVLLGRGSGCINTGGEKVYPEEVEEAIKTHPEVADALVVGIPDERFGQRVAAVVAPRSAGADEIPTLNDHLEGRLAGYKRPRSVVIVDAIRRAPNGKPDYDWARETAVTA